MSQQNYRQRLAAARQAAQAKKAAPKPLPRVTRQQLQAAKPVKAAKAAPPKAVKAAKAVKAVKAPPSDPPAGSNVAAAAGGLPPIALESSPSHWTPPLVAEAATDVPPSVLEGCCTGSEPNSCCNSAQGCGRCPSEEQEREDDDVPDTDLEPDDGDPEWYGNTDLFEEETATPPPRPLDKGPAVVEDEQDGPEDPDAS